MFDDDMKFSMDDIKDMVSEYFGEKVETVDAVTAKELLKQDTEDFMSSGIDEISTDHFSEEEEQLLKEFEQEKVNASEIFGDFDEEKPKAETQTSVVDKSPPIDVDELKKKIEEETRAKVEAEMREKIKQEMEEEKAKKREAVLKKIEDSEQKAKKDDHGLPPIEGVVEIGKKPSAPPPPPPVAVAGIKINYNEIMMLIHMFDHSQKIFANLLSKLMKKKPVLTMFLKTLEKAMQNNPDVLKKADLDRTNKTRGDGTLEAARIFSNLNALALPEEKKIRRFFASLSDVFEERLIATELATGIETKDEVMSNILIQTEKIFYKKEFPKKLQEMFMEFIIPNTTIKPGE